MKKLLAFLLALCLTLTLSVSVFADASVQIAPGAGAGAPNLVSKYNYSAVDSTGRPVNIYVRIVEEHGVFADIEDPIYDEIKSDAIDNLYYISVLSNDVIGPITLNVYAPGASEDDIVIVRDEWEVLEGANLRVDGDRAFFTVDAQVINQWHYFAIVKTFDEVNVNAPQEDTDNNAEEEGDDTLNVDDNDDNTAAAPAEKNPETGIVLAVLPMVVAAAAIVISKKR